jgi:hypothetical protein
MVGFRMCVQSMPGPACCGLRALVIFVAGFRMHILPGLESTPDPVDQSAIRHTNNNTSYGPTLVRLRFS